MIEAIKKFLVLFLCFFLSYMFYVVFIGGFIGLIIWDFSIVTNNIFFWNVENKNVFFRVLCAIIALIPAMLACDN